MEKKQETNIIKAYKGFDENLKCRGFQYKVGKEYKMNGKVSCCRNGFHACQSPLEVLDYYLLSDDGKMARFCEVEQTGTIDEGDNGSTKVASSKIKINRELTLSDLIQLGVKWIEENTNKTKDTDLSDNGEWKKKIASSGYGVNIASSGYGVNIASSGNCVRIVSSGNGVLIGSSGAFAHIGSSGSCAKIASSGIYAKIGSISDSAKICSNGDYTKIASSGEHANIGSSGYGVNIASSGNCAQITSNGDYAKIASSGDYAQIGSSGDSAKIGGSCDNAQIVSTGEDSVICCAGNNSIAKAKKGSWITLAEWKKDEKKKRWVPKCVKAEYVDGERIKGDTWYKLINGEFTEVKV